MKQLNYNEQKKLMKLWAENADENVFLFEVTEEHAYFIKATAEFDEDTGKLRINAYSDGHGWEIKDNHFEKLLTESLYDVLNDIAGEHAGDITICCNCDSDYCVYDTVYDCMWQFTPTNEEAIVLDISSDEFSAIFDLLRPSHYMVHFNNPLLSSSMSGEQLLEWIEKNYRKSEWTACFERNYTLSTLFETMTAADIVAKIESHVGGRKSE